MDAGTHFIILQTMEDLVTAIWLYSLCPRLYATMAAVIDMDRIMLQCHAVSDCH